MLRLMHLADLHLGWRPRHWPADRARARQRRRDGLLAKAVDVALERDVHLVVIVGDLFETYEPDDVVVHAAMAQLERLTREGIAVVTVPGNHDEYTYPSSVYRAQLERWPGTLVTNAAPELLPPVPTPGGDVRIVSLAYVGGLTPARSPLEDFPDREGDAPHVAAFHGTLGAGLGERSLPLAPDALAAKGYDYIALGHIHKPSRTMVGGTLAVYPGCVEGKGFDDPGVPHVTLVDLEPPGSGSGSGTRWRPRVWEEPVDVQPIRTVEVDLTHVDGLDALRERVLAAANAEAVVRVRLTGSLHFGPLDPAALEAEFAPHFFHAEVRDDTHGVAPGLLDAWADEPTVRGAFVARMRALLDHADDDDRRALVMRALRHGVAALHGGGE